MMDFLQEHTLVLYCLLGGLSGTAWLGLLPFFLGAFASFKTKTPKTSLIWAAVFFAVYIGCELFGIFVLKRRIVSIVAVYAGVISLALCFGNLLYPFVYWLKWVFRRAKERRQP